jgi:hypothetical protein
LVLAAAIGNGELLHKRGMHLLIACHCDATRRFCKIILCRLTTIRGENWIFQILPNSILDAILCYWFLGHVKANSFSFVIQVGNCTRCTIQSQYSQPSSIARAAQKCANCPCTLVQPKSPKWNCVL